MKIDQQKYEIRKGTKVLSITCNSCFIDGFMSEELEKEGWVKRTTIDEPRLSEIVEEYEFLGFEVRLEAPKLEDLDEDCRKCYGEEIDKLKTDYVRKRK